MKNSYHPLYGTWKGMLYRCNNNNSKFYSYYGGRGISVCDRWMNFHNFISDMGERPENTSLDRVDNDKGYSPDNCRWSTKREQQLNRRVALKVNIDGVEYIPSELAIKCGVKTDTIMARAARNLPIEKVLSKEKLFDLSGLSLGGIANGERQKAKTKCKRGHEYNEKNTGSQKNGRFCRVCHREKEARRRARIDEIYSKNILNSI